MSRFVRWSVLVAAVVTVCFPISASADVNWDAAKAGLAICADVFPDGSKAKEAFKAAGWRYEGIHDGMHLYTQNGYRAIAATNAGRSSSARCLVSASKMPEEFAFELGKPLVAKLKGAKELPAASGIRRWEGSFNGHNTIVGVMKSLDLGVMRGAAVGFVGK